MADHVYSVTELVGSSTEGIDAAVSNAVGQAAKTLRNLDWFTVTEIRGHVVGAEVADWQATVKLGFRVETE